MPRKGPQTGFKSISQAKCIFFCSYCISWMRVVTYSKKDLADSGGQSAKPKGFRHLFHKKGSRRAPTGVDLVVQFGF